MGIQIQSGGYSCHRYVVHRHLCNYDWYILDWYDWSLVRWHRVFGTTAKPSFASPYGHVQLRATSFLYTISVQSAFDDDGRTTATRWLSLCFYVEICFLLMKKTKNPQHLDCGRSIHATNGGVKRFGGISCGIVLSPVRRRYRSTT